MYEERDSEMPYREWTSNLYHPRNPTGHYLHGENRRLLRDGLDAFQDDLFEQHVLDVGCGYGYWLRYLVELGGDPAKMCGVDLSQARIEEARARNPAVRWVHGDAADLSLGQESIDLVVQSLVFSSIQDDDTRNSLALEIDRVARPRALLFWHDLRPRRRRNNHPLMRFSIGDVLAHFPRWTLRESVRCDPLHLTDTGLLRRALDHAIFGLTKLASDSWFLVLEKSK